MSKKFRFDSMFDSMQHCQETCSKQAELCDVQFQKTNIESPWTKNPRFWRVLERNETVTVNGDSQDSCAPSRWYPGNVMKLEFHVCSSTAAALQLTTHTQKKSDVREIQAQHKKPAKTESMYGDIYGRSLA